MRIGILKRHKFHFSIGLYSGGRNIDMTSGPIFGKPEMYTRLQTVWSLPGPSRLANKGHSPRCHRRPNGPGRLADKVVQPTTQSAEGCTYML